MTQNPPQAAFSDSRAIEQWVLIAAVIATSMAFIDATAVNLALPLLQSELNATGAELLWIVNAYGLFLAALLLPSGLAGDRWGRKRVFLAGIACFSIASLGCGLASDPQFLIAARGFQGIGAAIMIPGSLALIATVVPPERRGRAIGQWNACSVLMTALGPLLGGLLAHMGLWRAVFLINLPLAACALVIVASRVPENRSRNETRPIDAYGAWWCVCGLAALNLGLIESASQGPLHPWVVGGLLIALLSFVAFAVTEYRSAHPFVPLRLFKIKPLSAACAVTLVFYSALYGMTFFLSLNLIQIQRYDALSAGLAQLPMIVLVIALSPWAGRIVDRRGPQLLLTLGLLVASLGFLLLALPGVTAGVADYWRRFLPPLLLLGVALGMTAVPLTATMMASAPADWVGLVSGLNSTVSRLSSVIGVALLGPIALSAFGYSLAAITADIGLTPREQHQLIEQAVRFGDARPPPSFSSSAQTAADDAVRRSFVFAFRMISWICAGAALVAATLSACLFGRRSHCEDRPCS
jgi:EmrB/QacA subfamily drug resistance transporter